MEFCYYFGLDRAYKLRQYARLRGRSVMELSYFEWKEKYGSSVTISYGVYLLSFDLNKPTMKRILLLSFLAITLSATQAQISNNSFENWHTVTNYSDGFGAFFPFDTFVTQEPLNWTTINSISGTDTFGNFILVSQSNIANAGLSALQLTTDTLNMVGTPVGPRRLTMPGVAINGNAAIDIETIILTGGLVRPYQIPGAGEPFTQRLATLKGYYKYTPVYNDSTFTMDTCMIWATLRKGDSVIANAIFKSNLTTVGYTPFTAVFDYVSCEVPDTLVIEIASSVPTLGSLLTGTTQLVRGSVLLVDNLSYEVLQNSGCPLNFSVNLGTDKNACSGSKIILNPMVNGGHPPYTFVWGSTGNNLSCTNCKNPSLTLTQNSSYIVTVIDAANTQTTATINYTATGGSNAVQFTVANTQIDCFHAQDTTVVTLTGGTSPFTFAFGYDAPFSGTSPQTNIFPQPGAYVISVTDANGCISSVLDTIEFNGIAVAASQIINPNCINQSTGKIKVVATGGVAPYSYQWNNGSLLDSVAGVTSSTYVVTVTDVNSCSSSALYNLAPLSGWGNYVYLQPTASNCSNNGAITAIQNGGVPPFTFLWSNGSTVQNLTGLSGGVYTITVSDALGCTTTGNATIPSNCYSLINGTVFNDTNHNCIFDAGEDQMGGIYVGATLGGQTYYGSVLSNGEYTIQIPAAGTFTLNAVNSYGYATCGNITLCNNATQEVTLATIGDTSNNNNFGFASAAGFDLNLFMRWSAGNPGFDKTYRIYALNNSYVTLAGQATVTFGYDPNLIYQSSNLPVAHDLANHTLTWMVDTTYNYFIGWGASEILANFLVPVNLSLGYMLQSDFYISPTVGDCDSSNNHVHTSDLVTGSYDPNEKIVEPAGRILEEDSILTYTIGFQNTGTDSTHFIILKDTLSANLDASTVRNIASSHPYSEFAISGKGILTWTFNPLRLVDSFTNEKESHGFVKFTIKKKSNMPVGSIISNKAYIYFDYNEPVITNTVADTISEPNSIFEIRSTDGISVRAFPNPFSNATNIAVEGMKEKFDFELFDVTGRMKKRITGIETNQFQVTRDDLSTGVYFFKILSNDKKKTGYGKLVIE
jgi:hypothetical protein